MFFRHSTIRPALLLAAVSVFGLVNAASAATVLESVFPLSCQIGKQVTVSLEGKDVATTESLVFSIPEVTAKRVDAGRFVVNVAAGAKPQDCDVWCVTDGKVSNPRRFVITARPSVTESGSNDGRDTAQAIPFPGGVDGRLESAAKFDWFQFEAKAGQAVTLNCRSRTLDGSVEPAVTLFDPAGREIGHSTGRRREPLLYHRLTRTGVYRVRVADRAYRFASGSFYRLELFAEPVTVAAWPDLIQRGGKTEVSFYRFGVADEPFSSFHLAGSHVPLNRVAARWPFDQESVSPAWQSAIEEFEAQSFLPAGSPAGGLSPIRLTDHEVIYEDEAATESLAESQRLQVPALLNGRFNTRNDVDWFLFEAKKGETYRVDIYGDRLGQQMDLDAAIIDAAGKTRLTFPDAGAPKNLPPVLTQTSLDVSGSWTAPTDGEFLLIVRDLYSSSLFGVDRTYVASLRRSQPSYHLVVTPPENEGHTGFSIPRNGRTAIPVAVLRHDGFNDAVRIGLSEPNQNAGLALNETWIGPGQSSSVVILSSDTDSAETAAVRFLELEAAAESTPAITTKARFVTLLRAGSTEGRFVNRLSVSVSQELPIDATLSVASEVIAGEKLTVDLKTVLRSGSLKGDFNVEFTGLPPGMKAPATTIKPGAETPQMLIAVPPKTLPGRYSLAVMVTGTVLPEPSEGDAKPDEQHVTAWSNAVSFQVLPSDKSEKPPEK